MSDAIDHREEQIEEETLPFEFLDDADKISRKRLFFAQPVAQTRRAEMPDEIDDLDDVVHGLIPHLAIQIDFLNDNNNNKPKLSKSQIRKLVGTYAFDPDDLHKDARDSAHVRYARRQTGRFAEHGDGHLEHPQLRICPYRLELYLSRGRRDIKVYTTRRRLGRRRWSGIRRAGRLAPEAEYLGGVGCNSHSPQSLADQLQNPSMSGPPHSLCQSASASASSHGKLTVHSLLPYLQGHQTVSISLYKSIVDYTHRAPYK